MQVYVNENRIKIWSLIKKVNLKIRMTVQFTYIVYPIGAGLMHMSWCRVSYSIVGNIILYISSIYQIYSNL